jgi:hypothetical protein
MIKKTNPKSHFLLNLVGVKGLDMQSSMGLSENLFRGPSGGMRYESLTPN